MLCLNQYYLLLHYYFHFAPIITIKRNRGGGRRQVFQQRASRSMKNMMISSHLLRRVRLSVGTFRGSCAVCRKDGARLDSSYSNQWSYSIDTIHRNNMNLQPRSSIHNKTHTEIRYASSSSADGITSTKTEIPIQKPKKVTN